jgi:hypothetical protein
MIPDKTDRSLREGNERLSGTFAAIHQEPRVHHRKLEALTRLGFAARGLMYMLVGFLAVWWGRAEDASGALEYLNGGTGKLVLGVMAVGFGAYSFWRLAGAWLDSEGRGSDRKGIAIRLGGAGSGLVYLGFAYYAARLAIGGHGGGSGDKAKEGAATALSLPGGQGLVELAAAALLLVGLYQFYKAARGKFFRHLDGKAANAGWVRLTGRLGYATRGIVFLIMAYFLGLAGLHERAGEAGGMEAALASLPHTARLVVGSGLFLFGLFSLVEARHRRIGDPAGELSARLSQKAG